MRVKICGLTRPEDAVLAHRMGATDIGCVVVPDTIRAVSLETACRVFGVVPDEVHRVLVFRGASFDEVMLASSAVGTREVQLHRCQESVARQLIARGFQVRRVLEIPTTEARLRQATPENPIVLDNGDGGTGQRFDWSLLAGYSLQNTFVAGGITPSNVGELLPHRPAGIDVSSGVESVPGLKDEGRMRSLFERLELPERSAR